MAGIDISGLGLRPSAVLVPGMGSWREALVHDGFFIAVCGWPGATKAAGTGTGWRAQWAGRPGAGLAGSQMERVLGIGGYFIRASDPAALGAWYRGCLGLDADENGVWRQDAGLTVFAPFEAETDYLGSRTQQTMLNFRVRDLDAMLTQLRSKGADVADQIQDMEGVGRFGWVTDPEGNRIELWQAP